jgi:Tol biopolymer transport system component
VTQGGRAVRSADISPDGQRVVFDQTTPQEDLFTSRIDGREPNQLTNDAFKDRIPRWSPNAKRILFYSNRSGAYEAWTIGADGKDLRQETFSNGLALYFPLWSPDGKRIVVSPANSSAALVDLALPPRQRILQTLPKSKDQKDFAPTSWSPDGRMLAGTASQPNGFALPGIALYSFAINRYEKVSESGMGAIWLHHRAALLFLDHGTVQLLDLATRKPKLLLSPPANSKFTWVTVSPDDSTLYVVRTTDEGDIDMLTFK